MLFITLKNCKSCVLLHHCEKKFDDLIEKLGRDSVIVRIEGRTQSKIISFRLNFARFFSRFFTFHIVKQKR